MFRKVSNRRVTSGDEEGRQVPPKTNVMGSNAIVKFSKKEYKDRGRERIGEKPENGMASIVGKMRCVRGKKKRKGQEALWPQREG